MGEVEVGDKFQPWHYETRRPSEQALIGSECFADSASIDIPQHAVSWYGYLLGSGIRLVFYLYVS